MPDRKEPIPAAAVAFVRDTEHGIEVYLSRRPAHFRYYPGAFVFPGGRLDPDDTDIRATARREVREEIGIDIDTQLLVPLRDLRPWPLAVTHRRPGGVWRLPAAPQRPLPSLTGRLRCPRLV